MSEVSLKVTIAGRTYPLTVSGKDEPLIREAEKQLEESLNFFQKGYAVKDKQDLLAMAALQVTSRRMESPAPVVEKVVETVVERVEVPVDQSQELLALENLVDSYLS